MFTGSCLCGGVQFTIDSALKPIQVCHCSQCRKAQGTAFATNIPVATSAFDLVHGAELLASFESSPGKERIFCRRCGSPIYSRKHTLPDVMRIRAGLINEPIPVPLAAHFHVASKANWWPINDCLPTYDGAAAVPDRTGEP